MSTDIYTKFKEAGIEIQSAASDMHVPVSDEAIALLRDYEYRNNVTQFTSAIDGSQWFDVPFAYEPWWQSASEVTNIWAQGIARGQQ